MRDVTPIIQLEGEDVTCINQEFEKVHKKLETLKKKNGFSEERIKFLLETQTDFEYLESYVESLHDLIKEQAKQLEKQRIEQIKQTHLFNESKKLIEKISESLEKQQELNKMFFKNFEKLNKKNSKS